MHCFHLNSLELIDCIVFTGKSSQAAIRSTIAGTVHKNYWPMPSLLHTLVRTETPLAVVIVTLGGGTPHLAIAASRWGTGFIGVSQEGEGEGTGTSFWISSHCWHGWKATKATKGKTVKVECVLNLVHFTVLWTHSYANISQVKFGLYYIVKRVQMMLKTASWKHWHNTHDINN